MKLFKLFVSALAVSAMSLFSIPVSAQGGWGSLALLKGQTKVNCTFDYSDSVIQAKTEEQFSSEEPNWGLAQKEVAEKFYQEFNNRVFKANVPVAVGSFPEADGYTLCIKPSNILRNGNFVGRVLLLDASGEILMDVPIKAKGGVFGSFWNLLGDGMKDAAKTVAYRYMDFAR